MSKFSCRELNLQPKWYVIEVLLTALIGVLVSLALVLISAFIIITFNLSSDLMDIFTTIIKIFSIFIAGIIGLKRPNNGYIRGGLFGVVYTIFAYIVFSLLNGGFAFGITLLNDIAIGLVAGIITGIVSVNIRKN